MRANLFHSHQFIKFNPIHSRFAKHRETLPNSTRNTPLLRNSLLLCSARNSVNDNPKITAPISVSYARLHRTPSRSPSRYRVSG